MPISGFCNKRRSLNPGGRNPADGRDGSGRLEQPEELRALSIEFEQSADRTIGRPATADGPTVAVGGIDHINIGVANLRRSISFYSRVFGFRIIEDGRSGPSPYVIMTATGRAYLALHERHGASDGRGSQGANHWGFVVGDLDRVRQNIWDLGVPVADNSGTPDQIHQWSNSRSLYIADPDGHTIELVEVWGGGLSIP